MAIINNRLSNITAKFIKGFYKKNNDWVSYLSRKGICTTLNCKSNIIETWNGKTLFQISK